MKTNNYLYGFFLGLCIVGLIAWRVFLPEIMQLWAIPTVNVAIRAIFGASLTFVFLYSFTNK